ncbi:MAG: hypothetical protein HXS44_00405 [Theionarchaea archaeon]|nr:hypothetical protein [Theionarchaea archaeon]
MILTRTSKIDMTLDAEAKEYAEPCEIQSKSQVIFSRYGCTPFYRNFGKNTEGKHKHSTLLSDNREMMRVTGAVHNEVTLTLGVMVDNLKSRRTFNEK